MPLGSLADELSESWVESGTDWWVDLSVGFTKHVFGVSVVFDRPSVLMKEPVVVSAEEDEIVQIGGSSIGPMGLVMGMDEVSAATAGELTASVSMPELMT